MQRSMLRNFFLQLKDRMSPAQKNFIFLLGMNHANVIWLLLCIGMEMCLGGRMVILWGGHCALWLKMK